MQSTIKAAQDFIHEADGFAACLREMNSAVKDGIVIDFSEWGDVAEPLMALDAEPLETLFDIYREFYTAKCKKGLLASKAAGIQLGRRKKELPKNFEQEVQRWRNGEISGTDAAKSCGMAVSSFYAQAKKVQVSPKKTPVNVTETCSLWAGGSLTTAEAAKKIGVSTKAFQKICKENKICKNYIPDAFEKYCTLWEQGKISKEEAARLCKISVHRFDGCLRKTGKYQKEVV